MKNQAWDEELFHTRNGLGKKFCNIGIKSIIVLQEMQVLISFGFEHYGNNVNKL